VINSLQGGAAGGAARIKTNITKEEVLDLSKVLEIKFTISRPDIGRVKSGFDFDPNHPD
jgi:glutamate dehydrogenase/leucine dehydrogenase